ncbi:DNA end-binding protein Ku [Rhizobium pisi]
MIRFESERFAPESLESLELLQSVDVMAGPRANWKGYIKFGEVSFPVALYTAASSSERIAFNTLNRKTGNRVKREFIDSETGDPVEREEQVNGYEVENGQYIVLEPEAVAAAVPESDKTLKIESQIDTTYFDTPYYLSPNDPVGREAFSVIRDAMEAQNMVGISRLPLIQQLIKKQTKDWSPKMVADPVQERLLEIIAAKKKTLKKPSASKGKSASSSPSNVVNIMDALRKSVAAEKRASR